ncbi:tyrosine and phenylalanine-containing leader peptide [Corynebacterium glutamicum MB001]|nr:tyrosine and phenylalanine-containing leader peptide [Corynebacterium glutamicum MB001]ASW13682.1 tyrosine and phenylalanine-containing leader peptide [Corynebacterium glutamicum]QYO73222.1 tyrosine and phenylalanine-containing leader peptide [Corynebacterium glutamicum]
MFAARFYFMSGSGASPRQLAISCAT